MTSSFVGDRVPLKRRGPVEVLLLFRKQFTIGGNSAFEILGKDPKKSEILIALSRGLVR